LPKAEEIDCMRPPHVGFKAFRLVVVLCLVLASLLATGCAVSYGNHVKVQYLSATPESTQVTANDVTPKPQTGILNANPSVVDNATLQGRAVDTVAAMPAPAALPESLDIFFAGNPPPFAYQSLGLIEVQGAQYTNHGEVFDRLKIEAINRRADAITEVKRLSVQRESGMLFSEKKEEYAPVAMTAVAARYTDGRRPTTPLDSGVRKQVERSLKSEEDSLGVELFVSLVVLPIFVVLALVFAPKQ
jgi:hypothetical protein